jgi:hypothetical protein
MPTMGIPFPEMHKLSFNLHGFSSSLFGGILRYVKSIGMGVLFFKTTPNFFGFFALRISHDKERKEN